MEKVERRFSLDRETKNKQRYDETEEPGQAPAVGTLYVAKWALGDPPPAVLRVTIEAE